jgi:hypothetical protein
MAGQSSSMGQHTRSNSQVAASRAASLGEMGGSLARLGLLSSSSRVRPASPPSPQQYMAHAPSTASQLFTSLSSSPGRAVVSAGGGVGGEPGPSPKSTDWLFTTQDSEAGAALPCHPEAPSHTRGRSASCAQPQPGHQHQGGDLFLLRPARPVPSAAGLRQFFSLGGAEAAGGSQPGWVGRCKSREQLRGPDTASHSLTPTEPTSLAQEGGNAHSLSQHLSQRMAAYAKQPSSQALASAAAWLLEDTGPPQGAGPARGQSQHHSQQGSPCSSARPTSGAVLEQWRPSGSSALVGQTPGSGRGSAASHGQHSGSSRGSPVDHPAYSQAGFGSRLTGVCAERVTSLPGSIR